MKKGSKPKWERLIDPLNNVNGPDQGLILFNAQCIADIDDPGERFPVQQDDTLDPYFMMLYAHGAYNLCPAIKNPEKIRA